MEGVSTCVLSVPLTSRGTRAPVRRVYVLLMMEKPVNVSNDLVLISMPSANGISLFEMYNGLAWVANGLQW